MAVSVVVRLHEVAASQGSVALRCRQVTCFFVILTACIFIPNSLQTTALSRRCYPQRACADQRRAESLRTRYFIRGKARVPQRTLHLYSDHYAAGQSAVPRRVSAILRLSDTRAQCGKTRAYQVHAASSPRGATQQCAEGGAGNYSFLTATTAAAAIR